MINASNLVVCDSKMVENYIKENYDVQTKYIPMGSRLNEVKDIDKKTRIFMEKKNIRKREYYLVIGRFVPKNNIELIIKEFMLSDTKKDLVIVSDISIICLYVYVVFLPLIIRFASFKSTFNPKSVNAITFSNT